MPDEKPLRILIAGGGIAGPALAFWLQRLGHTITVVERWETLRVGGQQIDIRQQGVDVVKQMGILDEIRRHVVDEAGIDLVDEGGRSILFLPRNEPGSRTQSFSSEFEIMRGDLCRILHDRTKDGVTYRFGASVQGFEKVGNVVRVTLSDGTVADHDLLVGADGQGSRIRRAMYRDQGGDEQFLWSKGVYMCYYSLKRSPADPDHATCYFDAGPRVVMTRWHAPDQGQAYLMTMAPGDHRPLEEALGKDAAAQKEAFAALFNTVRWKQAGRILDALNTTDDFYAQHVVQVRGSRLSSGRVVLLGDAGFCPSPVSGMGTSTALVGAYVLAGEIARCKAGGDIEAALERYDTTLRPFIDRAQGPKTAFAWFIPTSSVGVRVFRFVLGLANKLNVQWLLQRLAAAEEEKEDWAVPRYEELHVGEEDA